MIVTLTANPSVDRTLEIPALERGEVVRATAARVHPGGKGVNVARALIANGISARAVLPTGGREGDQLLDLLSSRGLDVVPVQIAEPIRENVTIVEPDGTVTKLNAPGPRLTSQEVAELVEATVEASRGADWVALCGALPPGVPEDLYGSLVMKLHAVGVRVAVDASGTALTESIDMRPDLMKPNADELAEAVGKPIHTLRDVVEGARGLLDRGVGHVLVSLGERGAVSVSDAVATRAWTTPVIPRSTVGAGDATLAGFLATDGVAAEAVRAAVAWGAAAVRLPGTGMPGPTDIDVDAVTVEEIDAGRALDNRGRIG
ncbi:MAG TPA: 1-phosphofructokinase [Actinomycetota bacterium]